MVSKIHSSKLLLFFDHDKNKCFFSKKNEPNSKFGPLLGDFYPFEDLFCLKEFVELVK